jgi:RNA polymerase sigma factor (sigma-70 family)
MWVDARQADHESIADYYACHDERLSELHHQYSARLEGFLRVSGLSQSEAEDLAQEVWVRVMNTKYPSPGSRARAYDPQAGASFRTWLFTITKRLLMDAMRRQGRTITFSTLEGGSQEEEGEPIEATLPVEELSPEEEILARQQQRNVHECMNRLPPRERIAVALWLETEGAMTLQDLANMLEVSVATAHRVLRRAFELIRECLEQRGPRES